jgi:hypothetical protein
MRTRTAVFAVVFLTMALGLSQVSINAFAGVPLEETPSWMTPDSYNHSDVELGDFDYDGDLDIASYGEDHIHVYENVNGVLGTTATWSSTDATDFSGHVMWADIDKDNYPELFTSEGMYENANGVLSTTATWTNLSNADAFEIGDVNGDGFLDLILGDTNLIELYENVAGTIDDIPDWNTTEDNSPKALALGDVDNDNFDELAVGNSFSNPMRIYDNVAGSLNNVSIWSSVLTDWVGCLSWGDINGDSFPELFACTEPMVGEEPNRIYANSAGTLETTPSWDSSTPSYAGEGKFFDIDSDGDLDLVVANNALTLITTLINGTEEVYLNEGGVIDEDPDWSSTWEDSSFGMDIGDVTGDGYPDLVVANKQDIWYGLMDGYPGRITIYHNLGPNLPPQISTVTASPLEPETGKESTIVVTASDPDTDPLEYEFSVFTGNGTIVSSTGNSAVWRAPNEVGTYTVHIVVSDGKGDSDHRDFQITVVAPSDEEPFFSLSNIWFLLILIIIIVVVIAAVVAVVVRKRRLPPIEEELPPPPEEELPPPPPA